MNGSRAKFPHPPATRFQIALAALLARLGGVRAVARQIAVSPSTVSRVARGEHPDPKTADAFGAGTGVCPHCGGDWPQEPQGEKS